MSNVQDRKALIKDPINIVDVFSVDDLPPAITAPDGVSRRPLALNTRYYIHKPFVWPRCLFPVATNPNVTFNSTDIVGPGGDPPEIQIDGDDTPHFWGRELALIQFFNCSINDVGNAGAGRSTRLFDFVGGSGNGFSFLVLNFVTLRGFKRLGDVIDIGLQISAVFQTDNEGGLVTRVNPSVTVSKTYFIGNIYFIQFGNATIKPQIVFQGAPPSATFSNNNLNMAAGDASIMVDNAFSGVLDMVGNSYGGDTSGEYFRPDVSQSLVSMANADIAISAFADSSANPGVDTSVSVVPGHGLTQGQVIRIGDSIAQYDGLHTIVRVAADETSFDINVVFTTTTTGNVKLTRITTTANNPIVNNETITISGTTSYNGTFATVFAIGNNAFDIPVTFVANDATGTVVSTGQNEKTVGVDVDSSGAQSDSKAIGSYQVVGNTTTTIINTIDVFEDLDFSGVNAVAGSNIERWALVSVANVTVVDFSKGSLDTITLTQPGPVVTVLTEGTDFDAVTDNDTTAENIRVAIDAIAGLTATRAGSVVSIAGDLSSLVTGDATAWTVFLSSDLRYDDNKPFSGILTATIASSLVAGTRVIHFRAAKNGAAISTIISPIELKSVLQPLVLLVPITAVQNDRIKLQVANTASTDNINILDVSLAIM